MKLSSGRTVYTRHKICIEMKIYTILSDTSKLWLYHSKPKGDPRGRCTRSPHSPVAWLHGRVGPYGNLTYVRMQPAAIALNYSVKDIRHDVRQIIYHEKSQLNRLVWGSPTLAPITITTSTTTIIITNQYISVIKTCYIPHYIFIYSVILTWRTNLENDHVLLSGLYCTCLEMHGRNGEKIPLKDCFRSEFAAQQGSY